MPPPVAACGSRVRRCCRSNRSGAEPWPEAAPPGPRRSSRRNGLLCPRRQPPPTPGPVGLGHAPARACRPAGRASSIKFASTASAESGLSARKCCGAATGCRYMDHEGLLCSGRTGRNRKVRFLWCLDSRYRRCHHRAASCPGRLGSQQRPAFSFTPSSSRPGFLVSLK